MYVILTSKPGEFRTEPVEGVIACEAYDYVFYGQRKARFTIARVERPVALLVIDEAPPAVVNRIPSRVLESFETIERARQELGHLTSFGTMDTKLEPVA